MFLLSCQRIKAHIYRPQTKFAKVMFLHLSVSHSVHRGGVCLSVYWDTITPPPPEQTPPGADPPGTRHPPPEQTPPPPGAETATAADGTHPTGMHSCCILVSHIEKNMEKNFTCLSVQRRDILRRKL